MQQGELILRNTGRDEGYWVALLLITGGLWTVLEKSLTQDALVWMVCGLVLAAVVLRLTVLRSWHHYTLPWTLDDEKLTVGDRVVPLREIDSVGLKSGTFTKGSLYLIIRGRRTLRLAALVQGRDRARSVESIRAMGYALKQTIERLDGENNSN